MEISTKLTLINKNEPNNRDKETILKLLVRQGIPKDLVQFKQKYEGPLNIFMGKNSIKIKGNLVDYIGHSIELSGNYGIICYSIDKVLNSSITCTKFFNYCVEKIKNVAISQEIWRYENGRIASNHR